MFLHGSTTHIKLQTLSYTCCAKDLLLLVVKLGTLLVCLGVRVVVLHQEGEFGLGDKVSLAAAMHEVKQISRRYLTSVSSVDSTECCIGFKLHLCAQLLPLIFN